MYEVYSLKHWDSWCSALSEVKNDVYYTPEYCKVFEQNGDGTANLFVYKNGHVVIVYPFLKRRIELPFFDSGGIYFDITTPYGYGGPLCSVENPHPLLLNDFGTVFNRYCNQNSIISEFVRFHPILGNHKLCIDFMDVSFNRHTAYIDLTKDEDELWKGMCSTHRNKIRNARNNGIHIEKVDVSPSSVDIFRQMYLQTMAKNQADNYYFFNEEFFNNMLKYLRDMSSLFFAFKESKAVSGIYALHAGKYLHYHFNASDTESLQLGSNNLLIYETALWGHSQGYEVFHLGGGYSSGEDNLFRFKKKFSKGNLFEFYTGRKVHNQEVYNFLCGQWTDYYKYHDRLSSINFFPLYRFINPKVGVQNEDSTIST